MPTLLLFMYSNNRFCISQIEMDNYKLVLGGSNQLIFENFVDEIILISNGDGFLSAASSFGKSGNFNS